VTFRNPPPVGAAARHTGDPPGSRRRRSGSSATTRRASKREVGDVETLCALPGDRITWVDVRGLGDEAVLRRIGELFAIHPLALEDAVNVPQRASSTLYENQPR
jgi:magnesium transporter